MATNMVENAYAQQGQIAGQMAQAPRQLATGDTLIPMNYITGQYPSVYPSWFNQQQITVQTWNQFIQALNAGLICFLFQYLQIKNYNHMHYFYNTMLIFSVTMPAATQAKQNSLNMVNQAMKPTMNVNTAMNRNMQYQSQQMQIQQNLITETDKLLLAYNQQLFQPLGLQATSSYSSYAMMQQQGYNAYGAMAPQIGIIIKRIQQQVVYVVQQQQQQQQPAVQVVQQQPIPQNIPYPGQDGGGFPTANDAPPAYKAEEPPKYTSQ